MALPSADEQRTLRKGMPFLSVRSFTLTNSELITKKTIYTKILTLPIDEVLLEEHLLEMVCKSYKSDMKK